MSENRLDPAPWRTKQVLDPEVEQHANESIIQMIFDYEEANVAHLMFSNYTWNNADILKLVDYYRSLPQSTTDDLKKVQENCAPELFGKIMAKHAKNTLPIYGKGVEVSTLTANCRSRIFHDAQQYLESGSANAEELYSFVYAVMCETLEAVFFPSEIKNVLRKLKLMESLEKSCDRNTELGSDVEQKFSYECMKLFDEPKAVFPNFYAKLSPSITSFLVFFALHTIRAYCYAGFGIDGDIKFYQRDMYKKALEDKKVQSAPSQVDTKISSNPVKIKQEKRDSESDDDFCEIIDPNEVDPGVFKTPKSSNPPAQPVLKTEESEERQENEDKVHPESAMLSLLNNDMHLLPTYFVSKFRAKAESNMHIRDEIGYYKKALNAHFGAKGNK